MANFGNYHLAAGWFKIAAEAGQICLIEKIAQPSEQAKPSALTNQAAAELTEYFSGRRRKFDLPLKMNGTPFQIAVWQAALQVPYGQTASYKDLARNIGKPGASRAVGQALHKNPLLIVVPCHRIIGSTGKLTGYGCGFDLKQKLLQLEQKD
ncbi:MAG: methylated-DNA--[protein]-cysteine S-methyltransferase [Lactobacillus sp.]|jgi:O-6-methylguanine DNA methyltransferase|nr:methylated-DNA--[protein]-cysteine S-methyltransferase [Lactobacillus sp.]